MSKLTIIKEASHYFDDLTGVILPFLHSVRAFRQEYPYTDIIGYLLLAGILFVIFKKYQKKQANDNKASH